MKKKTSRIFLVALMVIVMVFTFVACNNDSSTPPPTDGGSATTPDTGSTEDAGGIQDGGILRLTVTSEGSSPLGVPWETASNDVLLMHPDLETLVDEAVDGSLVPKLAESWNIDLENKEILFKLREGVMFHDGTEMTSEDVAFCVQNVMDAAQLPGITAVEARSTYEVAMKFDSYQNNVLSRLPSKTCSIISKTSFDEKGVEWARENPVGTGPFQFESYTRGEKLVFTRFDNYWQEGQPHLDGVTYLFIRDIMTQQAAIQSTGEQSIDILNTTSGEQAATLRDLGGVQVEQTSIGPLVLVPSSLDKSSPLSNPDVRKAIAWAIDRESITDARGFGILTPAFQAVQPDSIAYLPEAENIGYDLAKAKEYLAAGGYPDGFKTKIMAMPGFADRDAMVIIQSQLAEIGIEVELEFPDAGGYTNYRGNGWDGLLAQHWRTNSNPNMMWNTYLTPVKTSFVSLERTPEVVDALAASSATPELDKAAAQGMVRAMHEEMMIIPVYNVYDSFVLKENVMDSGYGSWASTSIWRPGETWLAQ